MTRRLFLRVLPLAVVSLAAAASSYKVGTAACNESCDRDMCLYRYISAISTSYLLDTDHDLLANNVDCYQDYWEPTSNGESATGSISNLYCRYIVNPDYVPGVACDDDDKFIYVDYGECEAISAWTHSWYLTCYNDCE